MLKCVRTKQSIRLLDLRYESLVTPACHDLDKPLCLCATLNYIATYLVNIYLHNAEIFDSLMMTAEHVQP